MRELTLQCHPESPSDAVREIAVRVSRAGHATLALSYRLAADLARVRVPSAARSVRADRLWQHTCCEVFIGRSGSTAYHELNFSPSTEWAAYACARYRECTPAVQEGLDPGIAVRHEAGALELDATVRLDRLSPSHAGAALRIGLSMVVEEEGGRISYWALKHAQGKPDFHHCAAFALELDEARH